MVGDGKMTPVHAAHTSPSSPAGGDTDSPKGVGTGQWGGAKGQTPCTQEGPRGKLSLRGMEETVTPLSPFPTLEGPETVPNSRCEASRA